MDRNNLAEANLINARLVKFECLVDMYEKGTVSLSIAHIGMDIGLSAEQEQELYRLIKKWIEDGKKRLYEL